VLVTEKSNDCPERVSFSSRRQMMERRMHDEREMNAESANRERRTGEGNPPLWRFMHQARLEPVLFGTDSLALSR
jgi:hypothetical protein